MPKPEHAHLVVLTPYLFFRQLIYSSTSGKYVLNNKSMTQRFRTYDLSAEKSHVLRSPVKQEGGIVVLKNFQSRFLFLVLAA